MIFVERRNFDQFLQKKFYDKKLVDDILHFLSHNPLIGNKKFIIIENLKYLSEIHMNKLLKTFEEPPIGLSLFLLNPYGSHYLFVLYYLK